MTPFLSACAWLLVFCCVQVTDSAAELNFYRDEVPKTENAVLRELMEYLESQGSQFRLSSYLANQAAWKRQLELDRQPETDKLSEPGGNYGSGSNRFLPYNLLKYIAAPDRDELYDGSLEYPNDELPYYTRGSNKDETKNFPVEESYDEFEQPESFRRPPPPFDPSPIDLPVPFKGMKEEPLSDYHGGTWSAPKNGKPTTGHGKQTSAQPNFTYKFDDANLNEKHPFAVKPNDPRYYQDGPFFAGDTDSSIVEDKPKNDTKLDQGPGKTHSHDEITGNNELHFKDSAMIILPDVERRTGYNPLVVPVNHNLNNDIYFIAIVAGCSAAAMFALVLITLTWCRLKRGAKAAADIEYPAYGVTGPNKEVSPSGDQRLAQSAQMFHFQHQKQQIIALENRVSASRDPGSVSEAESEEENEEGDYTVYECPGLASTGEMEVKNPLFHDDPTPATPAQMNKDEDHNI